MRNFESFGNVVMVVRISRPIVILDLSQMLSPALRQRVTSHIFGEILRRAPFFTWVGHNRVTMGTLIAKAKGSLRAPGERIFIQGQVRPRNKEPGILHLSLKVWEMRKYNDITLEGMFSAVSKPVVAKKYFSSQFTAFLESSRLRTLHSPSRTN